MMTRRPKLQKMLSNDYCAMLLGLGFTVMAQSSSTTTSVFTPLVGVGLVPVHKMLPITLGANLGTTITPLFKALATMKSSSLQIAFCHLLFNIIGILIWFPVRMMRLGVLQAACTLGVYAYYWRLAPFIYILLVFLGFQKADHRWSVVVDSEKTGVFQFSTFSKVICFLLNSSTKLGCLKKVRGCAGRVLVHRLNLFSKPSRWHCGHHFDD